MKFAALFFLIGLACGQGGSQWTGQAKTTGPCSPAITGSGNTINIKTCGIEQAEEFKRLLGDISTNQQADTSTILKKLDECLKGIADRHLTSAQELILKRELAPLMNQKVLVEIYTMSKESNNFGREVIQALQQSGLDVQSMQTMSASNPVTGCSIRMGTGRMETAQKLATALVSAGVCPSPVQGHTVNAADELSLTVGYKP